MNLRKVRENWDIWILSTAILLILFWSLFVTSLTVLGQAKTWEKETFKSTGDTIIFTWAWGYEDFSKIQGWRLYRATETGSKTVIATGGVSTREFRVGMPGGSTKKYFYTVRPVAANGSVGPGVEFVVNRK